MEFILPPELLSMILLNINNLKKIRVSKFYKNFIDQMFNNYDAVFSSIQIQWKYNTKPLIKKLLQNENTDAILFLVHNYSQLYNLLKYVIKYSIKYKNNKAFNAAINANFNNKIYMLINAAKYNDIDLINKYINLIQEYRSKLTKLIQYLALNGQLEYIIKLNETDLASQVAIYGALGGHVDIVKYAMQFNLPETTYITVAINALKINNMEIFNLAIQRVKNDFSKIAASAVFYNRINIFEKFVKDQYKLDYNLIALSAADAGNQSILEFALKNGANNFTAIIFSAALHCKYNIIIYMRDLVQIPMDYNSIAIKAAYGGCIDLVKDIVKNVKNLVHIHIALALIHSKNGFEYFKQFITEFHLENSSLLVKEALELNNYDVFVYLCDNYNINLNNILQNYYIRRISTNILLYIINVKHIIIDDIVVNAAANNKLIIIKNAIKNGYRNYEVILNNAVVYDNEDIVAYILSIKNINIDLNEQLLDAILNEASIKIIDLLIINGATNLTAVINYGIETNNLDLIKLAIRYGFKDFAYIGLNTPVNQDNIILFALEHINDQNVINEIALEATIEDQTELAIQALNKGATNVNKIAIEAIKNYNKEILAKALEKGANNFKEIEKVSKQYYFE